MGAGFARAGSEKAASREGFLSPSCVGDCLSIGGWYRTSRMRGASVEMKWLGLFAVFALTGLGAKADAPAGRVHELKITLLSTMLADGAELGEWGFSALVEALLPTSLACASRWERQCADSLQQGPGAPIQGPRAAAPRPAPTAALDFRARTWGAAIGGCRAVRRHTRFRGPAKAGIQGVSTRLSEASRPPNSRQRRMPAFADDRQSRKSPSRLRRNGSDE